MGRCFRGEVATGGWDHLERADERRIQRAIIDPSEFSGCGGRVKEKSLREINPLEKRADRWRQRISTCRRFVHSSVLQWPSASISGVLREF